MLISFNWLKKYVSLPDSITAAEVAEKLKLTTVEVESVRPLGAHLANIVVGKILTVDKHPNADKLRVTTVDVGTERLSIVCGGSNLSVGQFVAVAKVGASVRWHGEGELIVLEPVTIRGVASAGMICGADEIGLLDRFPKTDDKEIVDLGPSGFKPGQPLSDALQLNDTILEIDNKSLSHRPDLWGHYGLAREVSVLFNRSVQEYKVNPIKPGKEMKLSATVENPDLCSRYMGVVLSGITVAPSPAWLRTAVESVGIRSINNIVDITNFVMNDLGQPLHAFDVATLASDNKKISLSVRAATPREQLVTLDGVTRSLDPSMVVIADNKQALALAGVMGGQGSAITSATTTILFEAATFSAAATRHTSTTLNLRTDSSARFEKSLDPNLPAVALARAVALATELCPSARVISAIADEYPRRLKPLPLSIPLSLFEAKIGCVIPEKTIVTTLTRLGFGVKQKKDLLTVVVPTWRATKDISIPEDVVEEVLRFFGYTEVPATLPAFPIKPPEINLLRRLERSVAELLAREYGYTEIYNYSFVSAEQIARLGDDVSKYLELDNPISKVKPYLRRNLLPNLLENISANLEAVDALHFFEIGKVFHGDDAGPRAAEKSDTLLPRQDSWVTAAYVGKKDPAPFWEARRLSDALAACLGIALRYEPAEARPLFPWQHPTRTAWLYAGEYLVGRLYELHPVAAERHGIRERVAFLSFNLSLLAEHNLAGNRSHSYKPLSDYPTVVRDLAFVVNKKYTHAELSGALSTVDPLIMSVELFDVFEGKHVPAGAKSMAYRLTYSSLERTLTSEEVDSIEKKCITLLTTQFSAEMR